MTDRLPFPRAELRRRTVHGAVVTGAFLVLIDGVALAQGLIVTRLLGPASIGLYGIASTVVISLVAFKRVGVDEAFVQQDEADQEREFQCAFTLELVFSSVIAVVIALSAPLIAHVYRDDQLLPLVLALAYVPVALALQAPMWVFFRRMDYRRQRTLQALQPLVGFLVTVPLAAATDLGVWSLVIGQVAGYLVSVLVALLVSPYRLRLRFERAVAARYLRFSAPILLTVFAALLVAQGQILSIKLHDGIAAAGFITLAIAVTRYIDRADHIVTATIFPAICAIQNQLGALKELYLKSNRATLMWVMPYAVGIVLFAPDLVRFALGPSWEPAVVLIQGFAVVGAVNQLGFNWFSFYRAHGDTRPQAVESVVATVSFFCLAVVGLLIDGFDGFVIGRVAAALVTLAVRGVFIRRLLPGVGFRAIVAPIAVPVVLAAGVVLALRFALWGGDRPLAQAMLEIALFVLVYVAAAFRRERTLLRELIGVVRGAGAEPEARPTELAA